MRRRNSWWSRYCYFHGDNLLPGKTNADNFRLLLTISSYYTEHILLVVVFCLIGKIHHLQACATGTFPAQLSVKLRHLHGIKGIFTWQVQFYPLCSEVNENTGGTGACS